VYLHKEHFTKSALAATLIILIQVIALIAHLVERRPQREVEEAPGSCSRSRSRKIQPSSAGKPFLVVAPSSVLGNWAAELERWAPALRVVFYRGTAENRQYIFRKQVQ
jgi:SNF2 family DNA or RNA helicase